MINPTSAILDDMTEPPHPHSFWSWLLKQLKVLCNQSAKNVVTAQAQYKHYFNRGVQQNLQLPPRLHVLKDRLQVQVTELAHMTNAPFLK